MLSNSRSTASTGSTPSYGKRAMRAAIAMLAMASLAAGQYPSSETACTREYTVVQGDTCDKIGQKTMTSTYQIMAFNLPNSGPDCYRLQVGAQLCLGRYGNDCQNVHRVRNGESCGSIARDFGLDVKTLRENNPSLNCDLVYDGLMLCVVNGLVRPPAADDMHLDYAAPEAGQMPLGEAIVAIAPPAPVNSTAPANTTAPAAKVAAKKASHFKHNAKSHHHRSHH